MTPRKLYLDVDGCLNPDSRKRRHKWWPDYKKFEYVVEFYNGDIKPIKIWLSLLMGAEIQRLAYECEVEVIWSTSWMNQANFTIAEEFGWDWLPVTRFDWHDWTDQNNCGKINAISQDCGTAAIVIVDDNLGPLDEEWIEDRRADGLPTLGVKPYSTVGLVPQNLEDIESFFLSQSQEPWALAP